MPRSGNPLDEVAGLAPWTGWWHNDPVHWSDIELGFAYRRDAAALAVMSRDLIETGLGWNYRAERVQRLVTDPESIALVARLGTQPIGFGIMSFSEERAHLALLAVSPRYQRRGLGRRIVAWLLDSASAAGVASIHVELRAKNNAANRLYRSFGFAETMRIGGYYGGRETAVKMVKVLRAPGVHAELWKPPTFDPR